MPPHAGLAAALGVAQRGDDADANAHATAEMLLAALGDAAGAKRWPHAASAARSRLAWAGAPVEAPAGTRVSLCGHSILQQPSACATTRASPTKKRLQVYLFACAPTAP